jgi:MFS family permease
MAVAASSVRPRLWYRGWTVVAVCILAGAAANGLPISSFSLFLKNWSVALHVPISALQLGMASVGFGSAILAPFGGILADRFPARTLISIGLAGVALFDLGIGMMAQLWQFLALYAAVLAPAVVLSTTLVSNALVCRWFVRRRGLALGVTSFGLGTGGVVIPPIAAALMGETGWRLIWLAGAALVAIVVLPLALLIIRDRPGDNDDKWYSMDDGMSSPVPLHGSAFAGRKIRWKDILLRRTFWILVITYLPMLAIFGGVAQNLGPIVEGHGMGPAIAGLLVSLLSFAQVVGTLIAGAVSDRFGNRRPLAVLALAAGVGAALVGSGQNVGVLAAGVMLAGLGNAFWPLLGGALAREFGSDSVGRAFGLAAFFVPLVALTPFVVARIKEATGAYTMAFIALAALSILATLICALFLREYHLGRTTDAGSAV